MDKKVYRRIIRSLAELAPELLSIDVIEDLYDKHGISEDEEICYEQVLDDIDKYKWKKSMKADPEEEAVQKVERKYNKMMKEAQNLSESSVDGSGIVLEGSFTDAAGNADLVNTIDGLLPRNQ